jgi:ribosomal-protein-serine acetyltransferase
MFKHDLGAGAELRLLEARHAAEVFALIDSNRTHLRAFLPWVDGTRTLEDTLGFRQASLEKFARNQGFDAGIFEHGKLAGLIGLHEIAWSHRQTSIGYWLGAKFQGRGLMARAVNAVLEHCFVDLGLHRIGSAAATGNLRSNAVLVKAGFKLEGVKRDAEWLYDHFVDHNLYGLLETDWRVAQAARGGLHSA